MAAVVGNKEMTNQKWFTMVCKIDTCGCGLMKKFRLQTKASHRALLKPRGVYWVVAIMDGNKILVLQT